MKKAFLPVLAGLLFCHAERLLSQVSYPLPSFTVESTYEENARLKRDNAKLQVNDSTDHNYMIVLAFTDSVPPGIKINVKVGSSSGSADYFQGTFITGDTYNVPAKTYYGVNPDTNKHYIKLYLEAKGAKNYKISLQDKEGKVSSAQKGTISN